MIFRRKKNPEPITVSLSVFPDNVEETTYLESGIRVEILKPGWRWFLFRSDRGWPWVYGRDEGYDSREEALAGGLAEARDRQKELSS